jgi:uncharacterized protein YbjT (DUF2867 family)
MNARQDRTIVVTGATGLQGSAVTRHLLAAGWRVRALTRNAESERARTLSALGAEVVQGDMAQPESLKPIFKGSYGVYSVQNPMISGMEGEIQQGKNVADAAKEAGVQHLVYGSAGTGAKGTGVPSWESKLVIEDYMKSLSLPLTILRPMAFMELMAEKKFFPPVSAWHLMPKLMGGSRKLVWLCTDDLGFIAAKAFAEPEEFISKELRLATDVQSLDECRSIYREVTGKNPSRFPMPVWLFERFVGKDLTTMWRWLRNGALDLDTTATRAIHPQGLTVRAWLEKSAQANEVGPAQSRDAL